MLRILSKRTITNHLSSFIRTVPKRTIVNRVPRTHINFLLDKVHGYYGHYESLGHKECTRDLVQPLIEECSKFAENELTPLYQTGDEGCRFTTSHPPTVTTPRGWPDAFKKYRDAGWQSLSIPEKYGGQGLPYSLSLIKSEIISTANWAWSMYPNLSLGAMNTILHHGSDQQKEYCLPKMTEGKWLGTMCLTEPHCGTDLSQVKTQATPVPVGPTESAEKTKYKINGTKIFISCGDHDFTDNICHIVLARLPNAPKGHKGISLFMVPKYLPGREGKSQNVQCAGIEQKMGIHGSSTCTMVFEDSIGWLMGEPNKGLQQMFTFMNTARLGTAIQGITAAELAYQNSIDYANERLCLRSLSGSRYPNKPADPIIVHPDVRRMLYFQQAIAQGGRAMLYHAGMLTDRIEAAKTAGDIEQVKQLDNQLGFITPILKGFLTEMGLEASSNGIQIWGGHGYIKENGLEQIYRDSRIATLYEGTTGIQALDLLGRKVMLDGGKSLRDHLVTIFNDSRKYIVSTEVEDWELRKMASQMVYITTEWQTLTWKLMFRANNDKEVVGSAAYDYLMYSGYSSLGYWWLRMAVAAEKELITSTDNETRDFYKSQIKIAKYYFKWVLPRRITHKRLMKNPPPSD